MSESEPGAGAGSDRRSDSDSDSGSGSGSGSDSDSDSDKGSDSDSPDLVPTLLRWTEFGGVWRLTSLSLSRADVVLCRCDGGEEVERLSSSDPATLAFLGEHPSSDI